MSDRIPRIPKEERIGYAYRELAAQKDFIVSDRSSIATERLQIHFSGLIRSRYASYYAEVVLERLASFRRTVDERNKLLTMFKTATREISKNHTSDVEQEYRRQNINEMVRTTNRLAESTNISKELAEENPEFTEACKIVRSLEISFGGPAPGQRRPPGRNGGPR